jgi:Family of unknown function (DUF5681)
MANKHDAKRVGYKNPPVASRFKPGTSGNPKGRPKGVRNFKDDLRDELDGLTVVHDGDVERTISRQRAFVRALVDQAVAGDLRAATILATLCTRTLGTDTEEEAEAPLPPDDRAILEKFLARELDRHRADVEPVEDAAEKTGAHDADEA